MAAKLRVERTLAAPASAASGAFEIVVHGGNGPLARCATVVATGLVGAPGESGLIGRYAASSDEAGRLVLETACEALAGVGVQRVLGPMDGSTWKNYRLVLPPDPDPRGRMEAIPPFPGEPSNPASYVEQWRAVGFAEVARYASAITSELGVAHREPPRGVRTRAFDPSRWNEELDALYAVSLASFGDNLYYAPIELAEFHALYEPLRPLVDPRLIEIAEDPSGRPLGFMLSYPAPPARAGETRRLVAKTIAVVPEARGTGLGHSLFARAHERASRDGFAAVIHALMHEENVSMRLSAQWGGRVFRRYALFGWTP